MIGLGARRAYRPWLIVAAAGAALAPAQSASPRQAEAEPQEIEGQDVQTRDVRAQDIRAQDVQELFAELDAAFRARDAARFLAPFRPLHRDAHARFVARMTRVLSGPVALERRSAVRRHWVLGDRGVTLIACATSVPSRPAMPAVVEHGLAVTSRTDDGLVIDLFVDVDAAMLEALPAADQPLTPKHTLQCHACNYTVDAGGDWLMVPHAREVSGCLEALSFWALDADLRVELTIHLERGDAGTPAIERLACLVDALGETTTAGPIGAWLPPTHADGSPPSLDGARCELRGEDGSAELSLATHGRLGYLFAVCGDPASRADGRAAIGRLLGSFTLLEPDAAPEDVVARITAGRQGGRIEGEGYHNARFGVRCDAPGAWQPRLAAGHYAFDVVWTCPVDHGRMRLRGMQPPPGADRWTPAAADPMVVAALEAHDLGIVEDSGWQPADNGFAQVRDIVAGRGEGPPRYALRLALDAGLLVLAEADANTVFGLDAVRAAFDSLRRER